MPATTYTHPDLPRLALRAEDLGGGVWRRSLLVDGVVTHTIDRNETLPNRHNAAAQASQEGFQVTALAHASGPDAGAAAQAREAIGEHERGVNELASLIARGRATADPDPAGTSFAVPAEEDARYGTIAVLSLMRQLADGIIGLQAGGGTIDDITGDLNSRLRGLANADGELSEAATLAAVALYRALDKAIGENR